MDEIHLFRIQYVDNTYQLVNWTEDQFSLVYKDMDNHKEVTLIDKCIFRLKDIRAIVFLEPVVEEETKSEYVPNEDGMIVTELGTYEKDVFDLLVAQGIDVGEVIGERRSKE